MPKSGRIVPSDTRSDPTAGRPPGAASEQRSHQNPRGEQEAGGGKREKAVHGTLTFGATWSVNATSWALGRIAVGVSAHAGTMRAHH
jgi:hypothetical protein